MKVVPAGSLPNQEVFVNVSEQVVLNCTVSGLSKTKYNWSIPDTCSSCPHTNEGIMRFKADNNNSGEYVCEAENKYERVLVTYTLRVTGKQNLHM